MNIIYSTSAIILLSLLNSCSDYSNPYENPEWITELIRTYESEPIGNPPQSIWRYTYSNKTVYYVPPQCCDQYSTLFDDKGNMICAPDGGITGDGDGKCSDFYEKKQNEKLIWNDKRIKK